MNILFINACPRQDSRTKNLADYLLTKFNSNVQERNLTKTPMLPLSEEMLERRTELADKQDFNHPLFQLAKEFAAADIIVIAAPFWDLSFPALLKIYIENINVVGITFAYNKDGNPYGLCKAKKLYYVTTAGGPIAYNRGIRINRSGATVKNLHHELTYEPYLDTYGYGYVKELAQQFYAIPETCCIKAENLDIENANVEQILCDTKRYTDTLFL